MTHTPDNEQWHVVDETTQAHGEHTMDAYAAKYHETNVDEHSGYSQADMDAMCKIFEEAAAEKPDLTELEDDQLEALYEEAADDGHACLMERIEDEAVRRYEPESD